MHDHAESGASRTVRVQVSEFNLAGSLNSGQVFHWTESEGGYAGMIGEMLARLEQRGGVLFIQAKEVDRVRHYLALDHPMEKIYASFPSDPAMSAALDFCRGIRLIRQPKWECLATFITSSMKQVAHIRQMSCQIRERFGTKAFCGKVEVASYPEPGVIARLREEDLRGCGLGYRAANLLRTARMIDEGEVDLEGIAAMETGAARSELCRLPGVGIKVANCVLLFGYERLRSFPVDVWIERILRDVYGKKRMSARGLERFADRYFGEFGGYAQQYLFHHARLTFQRTARLSVPKKQPVSL